MLKRLLKELEEYRIKPKKHLSQHFLIDKKVLTWIIEALNPHINDIVLEIGAGTGILTEEVAKRVRKVIAVEIDSKLVKLLREKFKQNSNIEIVEADILKIKIPPCDKIVSNVPYHISSQIIEKIVKEQKSSGWNKAVLTLQLEFARRLYAKPGTKEYSRITNLTQYYTIVKPYRVIPPRAFYPSPEVKSQIVIMKPKNTPPKVEDEDKFFHMVKILFTQKRKKALKVIRDKLGIRDHTTLAKIAEIVRDLRVYQLSLEQLIKVYNCCKESINQQYSL